MKNLNLMVIATVALAAVACGPKKEAPKMLVLYYSQTSNTKAVAEELAKQLGADVEAIVPTVPYDGDYQATIERGRAELEQGIRPEIQPIAADIDKYDVLFIGYPVWFGTYAPPIATFLANADLSGKKIVPFCTFGSGGLESSTKAMAEAAPGAEVLPGYGVRSARLSAAPAEIDQFLKASGFVEGECVKLAAFPEQHPASADEAAIFDAAVGDYPMIRAQATAVASRAIPGGEEHLFTATSLPNPDMPDMPARDMQVYVTVLDGEPPVFTQVVR